MLLGTWTSSELDDLMLCHVGCLEAASLGQGAARKVLLRTFASPVVARRISYMLRLCFNYAHLYPAFFLLCYSPAWALESSYTAPEMPWQTATVTTLPPAQPSSDDTNPCDFTDRWTMIDRVLSDWQGYNMSLLVDKCPNVCVLIYGDGNPDVCGIGVSCVLHMCTIHH
jgi:hypothetical protein